MNVRKPTDYSALFAALDELVTADLPTVDNLIGLAALLKVHIDDILIVNSAA